MTRGGLACNCFASGSCAATSTTSQHQGDGVLQAAHGGPVAYAPASQIREPSDHPRRSSSYYDYATSKPSFPRIEGPPGRHLDHQPRTTGSWSSPSTPRCPDPASVCVGKAQAATALTATVTGAASTAGVTWSVQEGGHSLAISPSGVVTGRVMGTSARGCHQHSGRHQASVLGNHRHRPRHPPRQQHQQWVQRFPNGRRQLPRDPLALLIWRKRRRRD